MDLVSKDRISIHILYATNSVSQAEAGVILDHFETALLFMINHPYEPIHNVELINPREMQLIMPGLRPGPFSELESRLSNGGGGDDVSFDPMFSSVNSMPELIGLQVSRTPERIAVNKYT